jgi:hypothetical protein
VEEGAEEREVVEGAGGAEVEMESFCVAGENEEDDCDQSFWHAGSEVVVEMR